MFYSPDYVNLSDSEWYYTGGVSVPIGSWLSVNANLGFTDLSHNVYPLIKDYTDWNISATATYSNFFLTVGYTDTDIDGDYKVTVGNFETDAQVYVMIGFKLAAP